MLSVSEAAARLQICYTTVRRWCLSGQLECVRLNSGRIVLPVRALGAGAEMARMQRKIDRLLDSLKTLQARVDRLTKEMGTARTLRGRECFISNLCELGFLKNAAEEAWDKMAGVGESAIVNPQSAIPGGSA